MSEKCRSNNNNNTNNNNNNNKNSDNPLTSRRTDGDKKGGFVFITTEIKKVALFLFY